MLALPFAGSPVTLLLALVAILLVLVILRVALELAWRLIIIAAVVLGILWLLAAFGIDVPGPTPF
ncbi:hypothetical protein [Halovenus halobia]|uniref:hypothetical protein n=1 Tax=Halovenus halobia TaxID=3396622 RepID=UPI003F569589